MQTGKKDISRELIIETTLQLIEENKGIKDVNIRGIAKEIGCTHTNLYNYFASLDEIFWEALGQALLNMIAYVESNVGNEVNDDEKVYLTLSNIIDYSMKHPGWFRLIWLEAIGGNPSQEVAQILYKPGEGLKDMLTKVSGNKITGEQAMVIGDILYTYLHGELCKWINNRNFTSSIEETKNKLLSNLKQLYKLLMEKGVNYL